MRRLTFLLILLLTASNCLALQKNVASQKWTIFAFDRTDNTVKTGDLGQITGSIWKDGVEDVIADTNPTELAHGYYEFDLDQEETNGDYLVMDAVSATGDIQVVGCPMALWTTAPYFSALSIDASGRIDIAKWIGTAVTLSSGNKPDVNIDEISDDTTAPGNLELAYDGAGYAGGTVKQDVKIVSTSQTALDAILKTTTFALAIADAIADEDISKSEHNVTNSFAKKIRGIEHVTVLHEGQAQGAGGGNNTIELAETASAVNDWYKDDWVMLVEGTGENQMHHIESYVGNTRIATLGEDWLVNPDSSTDYVIIAQSSVHVHRFEQEAKDEINAEVDSALSDYGANTTTPDASGTAAGLHSTTDGKVDANKTILDTLDGLVEDSDGDRFTEKALEQAPSGTGASAATIADAVWDELDTGHTDAGKAGQQLWTDLDAVLTDTEAQDTTSEIRTLLTGADTPVAKETTSSTIAGYTDDIGVAGVGLTAIDLPNQTMDIIGNITGDLSGSVGSVSGAVGSVTAGVDLVKIHGSAITETTSGRFATNWNTFFDNADSDTAKTLDDIGGAAGLEVDVTKIHGTAITESTVGRIAGNFSTFWDNADAATAKVVDNVGASAAGGGSPLVLSVGNVGNYKEDSTIVFVWRTIDQGGAAVNPSTVGVLKIYKEDSDVEVTADTGITDTRGFDGITGVHVCVIDLSANTFYARDKDYSIVLTGAVVDSQTTTAVIATFSIEKRYVDEFDRGG